MGLRLWLFASVALIPAACGSPGGTAGSNVPRVVVEGDEFSKAVTVSGVQFNVNPFFSDFKQHWYLRSAVNPEAHKAEHELYAEIRYPGGLNGSYSAADNSARPHRVHLIYREYCVAEAALSSPGSRSCVRLDTIGISIDETILRANQATGMAIKLSAASGFSVILDITAEMISAQLYAEEQIFSGAVVVGKTVRSGGTIAAAPIPSGVAAIAPNPATPITAPPGLGISYMKVMFSNEVMIVRVQEGSRAASAGLQPRDILVRYSGRPIANEQDVKAAVDSTPPGSVVPIEILRDRQPMTVSVQM